MEVRFIEPRDNDALIELSRLTPMEGAITVVTERAPRYASFYDLHGVQDVTLTPEQLESGRFDTWSTVVAEENGQVIGVLGSSSRRLVFDGKLIRVGYLMDARVHPDHRRKGVIRSLGFEFARLYGHMKFDCVMGYIMRGNLRAVQGMTEGGGDVFKGQQSGSFHLYQISMYRPYWVGKLNMERATPNDRREIAELLADFYRSYNFSPPFSEEYLARQMKVSLGYSWDQIRLVRENGRIVALLGLWDQTPVRQVITLKNTGIVRVGIGIARFLHLFIKSPKPPENGKPLRSLYIKHIACRPGHEDTLRRMLKATTNEVRRAGTHHFIWGAYYHTDPLRRLFDGLTKTEVVSDLFWGPWNTGWNADPAFVLQQPAYADFSLV